MILDFQFLFLSIRMSSKRIYLNFISRSLYKAATWILFLKSTIFDLWHIDLHKITKEGNYESLRSE